MSNRTTLKTYFLSGSSPTEAQFADLIDSVLVLEEDLVNDFLSTSTADALTANAGKILNDSLTSLDARVVILENASTDYLANYYTKGEMDSSLNSIGVSIDGKVSNTSFNDLSTTVSGVQSNLANKSDVGHSHVVGDVTGLQDALDDKTSKTYVDNTKDYLEGLIGAIDPGVDLDHLDDYADLANKVSDIETSLTGYATIAQVSSKAESSHTHNLSDILDLDISDYYNKASVDTLLANVEPKAHTHIETDITDLDKYTKAQTDQGIQDHSQLQNNPHAVTKAQLGLDKVENLSVAEIFSHNDAPDILTQADLDTVDSSAHVSSTNNPHSVTKSQVGLGNVPDIDVNTLLTAHLAADNPHNLSTTLLDVYTKAETQTKIEENYDAHRYETKPASPTDGGGAVGDIAYHSAGLYFKFGPTEWRQILTSAVFNDGTSGSSFQIETPKLEVINGNTSLFEVDSSTNTTTINTTNVDITGQVSLGSGLTAQGAVSLGSTLNVSGASVLSTLRATTVTTDSINSGSGTIQTTGTIQGGTIQPNNKVKAQSGDLVLEGKDGNKVQVNDALEVTGATSLSGATVGTTGTNANLTVNGNITATGNLTIEGTTTSIDTTNLVIEDNIVLLNKNQTGTPAGTLKSGFEVERGTATNVKFFWDESDDKWKADIGGTIKTVAFTDTAPASHTHALSAITDSGTAAGLDVAATGNATSAQVVKGNDTRLTNSRTPTSHAHGNITNTGKIGSAANLPVITTTGGIVTTGSFGTGANTFCQGNDSRLSDARAPTAHNHDSRYARYDASQSLSAAQKSQILGNIGAAASADVGLTQTQVEALLYSK